MFAAFFESIKFVAHLLPVSFLRIFFGYVYLQQAIEHYDLGWLDKPALSLWLNQALLKAEIPPWYAWLIENAAIPYWQQTTFIIIGLEAAIGISYLVGYLVRPIALIGAGMMLAQFAFVPTLDQLVNYKILFVVHVFLAWIGAGRVLGFDYYFYKKQRGIWW